MSVQGTISVKYFTGSSWGTLLTLQCESDGWRFSGGPLHGFGEFGSEPLMYNSGMDGERALRLDVYVYPGQSIPQGLSVFNWALPGGSVDVQMEIEEALGPGAHVIEGGWVGSFAGEHGHSYTVTEYWNPGEHAVTKYSFSISNREDLEEAEPENDDYEEGTEIHVRLKTDDKEVLSDVFLNGISQGKPNSREFEFDFQIESNSIVTFEKRNACEFDTHWEIHGFRIGDVDVVVKPVYPALQVIFERDEGDFDQFNPFAEIKSYRRILVKGSHGKPIVSGEYKVFAEVLTFDPLNPTHLFGNAVDVEIFAIVIQGSERGFYFDIPHDYWLAKRIKMMWVSDGKEIPDDCEEYPVDQFVGEGGPKYQAEMYPGGVVPPGVEPPGGGETEGVPVLVEVEQPFEPIGGGPDGTKPQVPKIGPFFPEGGVHIEEINGSPFRPEPDDFPPIPPGIDDCCRAQIESLNFLTSVLGQRLGEIGGNLKGLVDNSVLVLEKMDKLIEVLEGMEIDPVFIVEGVPFDCVPKLQNTSVDGI